MGIVRKLFKRSCRQASRLISDREERPLGWRDRIALRLHLKACLTCVRYEQQVRFMGRAMGRWRTYSEENGITT